MNKVANTPTKTPAYENNPFFVAVNGLEILFKKAKAVGIALAVIAGLSLVSAFVPGEPAPAPGTQADRESQQFVDSITAIPMEGWLLIAAIALLVILIISAIGIVIRGIMDYTAAQLANDKQVTLSEAFRAVFANFWGYTWVLVIMGVKIFLWSLLLIVPGIIMAIRYSLAGVVYFDKKLPGNGSVKESARLTKGAWLTTMASQSLFNIVTLGLIEPLLVPGTQAILYRQYKGYDATGVQKPSAHILSWLTLLIPITLVALILLSVILLAAASSQS